MLRLIELKLCISSFWILLHPELCYTAKVDSGRPINLKMCNLKNLSVVKQKSTIGVLFSLNCAVVTI